MKKSIGPQWMHWICIACCIYLDKLLVDTNVGTICWNNFRGRFVRFERLIFSAIIRMLSCSIISAASSVFSCSGYRVEWIIFGEPWSVDVGVLGRNYLDQLEISD